MSPNLFTTLNEQLGVLTWPLLLSAFISLMIILERLALIISELPRRDAWLVEIRAKSDCVSSYELKQVLHEAASSSGRKSILFKGAQLLMAHANQDRLMREEIISLWLMQQKQQLKSGLKVLQVIGVIAPLLGLLGTVLGLIEMFNQLGQSTGPVMPSQLASGLGMAMNTTAAGLFIALPAIIMAHLFGIWSDRKCRTLAHVLNQINLSLAGVKKAMTLGVEPTRVSEFERIFGYTQNLSTPSIRKEHSDADLKSVTRI